MKKKILIVSVMLVFATVGLVLAGQHGRGGCDGQNWKMDSAMMSDLNLTPEQTEKVRSQMESLHADMAPLRNQKFQCKTELKLLWMQMKPDVEKIKAKQKQLHDLKWQVMEKVTDYRVSLRNVLTPEQLSRYLIQTSDRQYGPRGKGPHHGRSGGKCGGMGQCQRQCPRQ